MHRVTVLGFKKLPLSGRKSVLEPRFFLPNFKQKFKSLTGVYVKILLHTEQFEWFWTQWKPNSNLSSCDTKFNQFY